MRTITSFFAIIVISSFFAACAVDEAEQAASPSGTTAASESQTTEQTLEQLKATASAISYDDLFRNNEEYVGNVVWFAGQVVQVIEGDDEEYQLRVNVTKEEFFWDDAVFLRYSGDRLLEDDVVEFVAKVNGLITYEALMGNDVTIPDLTVLALEITEDSPVTPTLATPSTSLDTPSPPSALSTTIPAATSANSTASPNATPGPAVTTAPQVVPTPSSITPTGKPTTAPQPTAAHQATPIAVATSAPQPTEIPSIGERSNPIPLNRVVSYPSWDISVVSFDGDANSEIAEENQFNEPPPEGHVYVLVHLQGTYTGAEFGSLWLDLDYYVVGNTNITYKQAWVVTPNDLTNLPDALPGGSIAGNLAFLVPDDIVDSLLLLVTDGGLRYANTVGYFSLDHQAADNYSTPVPGTSAAPSTPFPGETRGPASTEVQQTTSTSPSGDVGERSNPIPLNRVVSYPSWDISVVSFDGNANSEIAEENQFNEPPPDGHVYVLVHFQGTYTGTEFGSLWLDLDYYVVGNTNITYEQAWVVTPNDLTNLPDALPGGTVGGNLAFLVPEDVVDSLLLLVTDGGLRYANTVGYFSLR